MGSGSYSMNAQHGQQGVTLVELIVVMAVTLIAVGFILSFTLSTWGSGAVIQAKLETFVTRLNANDSLRELLAASSGLIIQNGIPDSRTNNPDPANASGHYWLPLHATPGNYAVPASGSTLPLLYFKRPSVTTSNAIAMNGSQPYDDEYVIYLSGTTKQVLLRTLANPSVAQNKVTTSCPPAIASAQCPADKLIADDLTSVDLRYFSRSGNPIDWTSTYDTDTGTYAGPDFPLVEAVEFNLHMSRDAAFHGVGSSINQTVIRVALLNT